MENNDIPVRLSRKTVYNSNWLELCLDQVQLSSGQIIENFHMLESKFDSIVVVMINDKNQICFINSPRYTTQSIELELPSGGVDKEETILDAAKREVIEETGYTLIKPEYIYTFYPSNSISNQKSHIVFGKCDVSERPKAYDNNEVVDLVWHTEKEIYHLIKDKSIKDGYALIALLFYFQRKYFQ